MDVENNVFGDAPIGASLPRGEERVLLHAIVDRGLAIATRYGHHEYAQQRDAVIGYIVGCHFFAAPLRLQEMLAGDDANFAHDFFGILRHFDPRELVLCDGFYPRYGEVKS